MFMRTDFPEESQREEVAATQGGHAERKNGPVYLHVSRAQLDVSVVSGAQHGSIIAETPDVIGLLPGNMRASPRSTVLPSRKPQLSSCSLSRTRPDGSYRTP